MEIENEGLDDCQAWSIEDKAVIDLWDREVKKVNGNFELPIPWKDRSQTLPNNFVVAKKRIDSLFKKFDHDADYCAKYSTEIDKLLEKKYAKWVPADELFTTDRTWYFLILASPMTKSLTNCVSYLTVPVNSMENLWILDAYKDLTLSTICCLCYCDSVNTA